MYRIINSYKLNCSYKLRLSGLADEMADFANTKNLFRHFEGLFADIASTGIKESYFYPLGLKREHLVGAPFTLPNKYLAMLDDIDLPIVSVKVGTLNTTSVLGMKFDEILTEYLGLSFANGTWNSLHFPAYSSVPSGYLNPITHLNSNVPLNQYNIMVANGWAEAQDATGIMLNSALDLYFLKTDNFGKPIFTSISSGDIKINFNTDLGAGQKQIGINGGGTYILPTTNGSPPTIFTKGNANLSGLNDTQKWANEFANKPFTISHLKKFCMKFETVNGQNEVRLLIKD